MNLKLINRRLENMKTEATAIISKAAIIKDDINEIKESDDLRCVEEGFRQIAEWANNMVDLCLVTYDEFEEE